MTKTLVEAPLSTRNARQKLGEGLHWRGVDSNVHLGYRRGKRAGRWLVRWYEGAGKYRQEVLASADDILDADNRDCLSFDQAKSAAILRVRQRRADAIATAAGPMQTVRSAVESYLLMRSAREAAQKGGRRLKKDATSRLTKHVLGARDLADAPLHTLNENDLSSWKGSLSTTMAPATVKRIVNDFKAALNAAATKHRTQLPAEYQNVVKAGLASTEASQPVARDAQALSDIEIRRVLDCAQRVDEADGWEGDLFRLVLVLAATGARFSQACRMLVADVQVGKFRVMVPVSHKGRGRKNSSHIAVRVGDDVLTALRPAIAGRRGSMPMLERWRHKQTARTQTSPPAWIRDARGSWEVSTELSRPWRKIADMAGLPADVVPYALRHSSIVRLLRMGLPVRLVAALHDTSAAMIEAHYSAAIVDALDHLAAGAVIPLVPQSDERVVPLRRM